MTTFQQWQKGYRERTLEGSERPVVEEQNPKHTKGVEMFRGGAR